MNNINQVPEDAKKISRFLNPNEYREAYIFHIVKDLKKHKSDEGSIYFPKRGEVLKFDDDNITVVNTKYGEIKVRYFMREGPFKEYNMSTDEWEYSE